MKKTDIIELNSIKWVLRELMPVLEEIQALLVNYVDHNNHDQDLPDIVRLLDQTQGTLKMVELYGAAMLAEEMLALVQDIQNNQLTDEKGSIEILLRASLELPNYLDRIQAGSPDVSLVLLPLLNSLRAARAQPLVTENLLFLPDLFIHGITDQQFTTKSESALSIKETARKIRLPFIRAMLKLLHGEEEEEQLERLDRFFNLLNAATSEGKIKQLWLICRALIESLATGDTELNVPIKMLLGQVERQFQPIINKDESWFAENIPVELLRNLLFYIAQSDSKSKRINLVKTLYQLDELLPSKERLDEATKTHSGPSLSLIKTASSGVKEDISEIKNIFECYVHAETKDPTILSSVHTKLSNISATLGMLGISKARTILDQQLPYINDILETAISQNEQEQLLDKLAEGMLTLESAIEDFLIGKAHLIAPEVTTNTKIDTGILFQQLPESESKSLMDSLLSEVVIDISEIQDELLNSKGHHEDGQTSSALQIIKPKLTNIKGAFELLNSHKSAQLIEVLESYLSHKLQHYTLDVLDEDDQNLLAEAITSIEFYVYAFKENDQNIESTYLAASRSVEKLRHTIEDQQDTDNHHTSLSSEQEIEPSPKNNSHAANHHAEPEDVLAQQDQQANDDFQTISPGIDDELFDIFIEEVQEEFEALSNILPLWKKDPENMDYLTPIRRTFHTLKGSGRVVGAERMSELSWAIECLLNVAINGTAPISNKIIDLIFSATETIPVLVKQLMGNTDVQANVIPLIESANYLASNPIKADEDPIAEGDDPTVKKSLGSLAKQKWESASQAEKNNFEITAPDVEEQTEAAGDAATTSLEDTDNTPVDTRPTTEEAPEADKEGENLSTDLATIFSKEAKQHIASIQTFIDNATQTQAIENTNIAIPNDTLVRAIHTLCGGAQTIKNSFISSLICPLENISKLKKSLLSPLDKEELKLLSDIVGAVQPAIDAIANGQQEPAVDDALLSRINLLSKAVLAEADQQTNQDGLLNIFLEEAIELLGEMEKSLDNWRASSSDNNYRDEINRVLHTLKGGARMALQEPIADLTHALETSLTSQTDVTPKEDYFELLQDVIDTLAVMLDQAKIKQTVTPATALIKQLNPNHDDKDEAVIADNIIPISTVSRQEKERTITTTNGPDIENTEQPDSLSTEHAVPSEPAISEQVRVSADLLDNLVNYAGEATVYHSRLGQHLSDFRFNQTELEQTLKRLRQQLREMELETEAQILYNYDQDNEHKKDFDPLEMDRYSHIQQLSRGLAESVSDLESIKTAYSDLTRASETLLLQQSRVSTDLQDGLMRTRMARFDAISPRLSRIVRQTAQSLNKKASLIITGADNEIDRSVQTHLIPALEHILRNAVAHGLESPEQRLLANKPETGKIFVELQSDGADILINVRDDGQGVNFDNVRNKAITQGLIKSSDKPHDDELLHLLLVPGFTTSEEINQVSGRGVGLDVVEREIKQLNGSLKIQSNPGAGTDFMIRLPQALAITQALLIDVNGETYAIPVNAIHAVERVPVSQLQAFHEQPDKLYQHADNEYQFHKLSSLLALEKQSAQNTKLITHLIMLRSGGQQIALQVDNLLGHHEIVIKPLGRQLNNLRGFSGATLFEEGKVVLVLDIGGLLINDTISPLAGLSDNGHHITNAATEIETASVLTAIIVDDSITIRKVSERMLKRNGFNVLTAKDGIEALTILKEHHVDIMLLDIEMPRMDGFELATYLRSDSKFSSLPIIMITSRTGQKHRERAQSIGINHYLGKPYQEVKLINIINDVLNEREIQA